MLSSTPVDQLNQKARKTLVFWQHFQEISYLTDAIKKQVVIVWSNQKFIVIKYQVNR